MKAAFTIATANYLALAKTLSESFVFHNSEFTFYIILLDKINGRFSKSLFKSATIIEIEELQIKELDEMAALYTIFELSNALKPFAAQFLLNTNTQIDKLLYFDCDILVLNSVEFVNTLLNTYPVIITPHITSPLPNDGLMPDEKAHLNIGIYNGGFFALKRAEATFAFLVWWKEQLKKYCFVDLTKGLFVDQIWLNPVPVYFRDTHILRDAGYNAAYWNLHERNYSVKNSFYYVNQNSPLVFFHFSGYNFDQPDQISAYQSRFDFIKRPEILPLYKKYRQLLEENNHIFFRKLSLQIKVKTAAAPAESEVGFTTLIKKKMLNYFRR